MAEILVVEDNKEIANMLELRLSVCGHIVHKVANGSQGVDYAMSLQPDLILMDMQMPIMGGEEAVKFLRNKGYQGIIASLSAAAMHKEIKRAMDSGCNAAFTKPIGDDFEDRIEQLLERENG